MTKIQNKSGGGDESPLEMCEDIEEKIQYSIDDFVSLYPGIETDGMNYVPSANEYWTSAFYIGMVLLAYERTEDNSYLKYIDSYLDSFEYRIESNENTTHDLGFLYTLSCVSLYKETGNERAKELALKAAVMLSERYNDKGQYIQAWGKPNEGSSVDIIVDTMMNLPLLYWASEVTGDNAYSDIASHHADTCMRYLVRDDYSTFHAYYMVPETGEAVRGHTYQGFHDNTTWARGQAWVVYGFILAYKYTGKEEYLETAIGTADYFISNLPSDMIPYWDFTFTDDVPDIKDSSAGSIFLCGLLELSGYVEDTKREQYLKLANKIVTSLYDGYFVDGFDNNAVLRDGMYHREYGNSCTIWGDYFFYEALVRMSDEDWISFW